jgi:hypothetical protein
MMPANLSVNQPHFANRGDQYARQEDQNYIPHDAAFEQVDPHFAEPGEPQWMLNQQEYANQSAATSRSSGLGSGKSSALTDPETRHKVKENKRQSNHENSASISGDTASEYQASDIRSVQSSDDGATHVGDDLAPKDSKLSSSKLSFHRRKSSRDSLEDFKGQNSFINTPPRAPSEVFLRSVCLLI